MVYSAIVAYCAIAYYAATYLEIEIDNPQNFLQGSVCVSFFYISIRFILVRRISSRFSRSAVVALTSALCRMETTLSANVVFEGYRNEAVAPDQSLTPLRSHLAKMVVRFDT